MYTSVTQYLLGFLRIFKRRNLPLGTRKFSIEMKHQFFWDRKIRKISKINWRLKVAVRCLQRFHKSFHPLERLSDSPWPPRTCQTSAQINISSPNLISISFYRGPFALKTLPQISGNLLSAANTQIKFCENFIKKLVTPSRKKQFWNNFP